MSGRTVGLAAMVSLWCLLAVLLAVGFVPMTKALLDTLLLFGATIGGTYAHIRVRGQRVLPQRSNHRNEK